MPPGTGVQRSAQGQAVSDRLRFDGFQICPTERQLLVAASAPLPIDHSVVQSRQLADEPDMTGASIGAYAP